MIQTIKLYKSSLHDSIQGRELYMVAAKIAPKTYYLALFARLCFVFKVAIPSDRIHATDIEIESFKLKQHKSLPQDATL